MNNEKKDLLNRSLPHIFAVVLFLLISFVYFSPLLEGKKLQMSDVRNYKGMAQEVKDFRQETGKEALWTNRMFGGMPAYLISVKNNANIFWYVDKFLKIGERPASYLFICLLGFYITLLIFGAGPWLSIVGAIAFSFTSYFFIVIEAGHTSKAVAMAYMSPFIAGVYMAYRRNLLLGCAVTAFFLALGIFANHPQINYYAGLTILIYGIVELVQTIKERSYQHFLRVTGFLLITLVLVVGTNFGSLWRIYEYGEYSMRGSSELTKDKEDQTSSGLTKSYATAWSYGIDETLTLFIPNFAGGSSHGELNTKSNVYKELNRRNVPNARQIIKQLPLYHGAQPFTSGPVYVGAVVFFLFFLGLFIIKGPIKWWLLIATVFSIMLAWGKNFMPLTEFFLDYFPGYSKFRTVSMTLVIAEFTMPLLAFIAIKQVFEKKIDKEQFLKGFKYSFYIVSGLALIFTLMPGLLSNFTASSDSQLGWPDFLIKALREDRRAMLQKDALRSLIFVVLTAGLVYLIFKQKVKQKYAYMMLGALVLFDMWPVNKRYLNNEDFAPERVIEQPYKPSQADRFILNDEEQDFRVLDLTVNIFNSSRTSYFHNAIGGYHGAKMQRYQDMIDYHIHREIRNIGAVLQKKVQANDIHDVLKQQEILNMLNTKYIIYNQKAQPIKNPHRDGNAWFVDNFRWVGNADEEIDELKSIDPSRTALIDKRFEDVVEIDNINMDTTASIHLVQYKPNHLTYTYTAAKSQIALFSEVYYPKGWNAFIDEQPAPHFRANYILRGMVLPEGKHTVEFKFEPRSYFLGSKVSYACSALVLLLTLGVFAYFLYQVQQKEATNVDKPQPKI